MVIFIMVASQRVLHACRGSIGVGLVVGGAGWRCSGIAAGLVIGGIVVGWHCGKSYMSWQVLCAMMGWHCGSCAHCGGVTAGLGHVRVVSQHGGIVVGLPAMLGWHWGGIMVGRVCCNRVKVAVDLCVVKGEEVATMGSQVVRWRWQWGLATLRRHGVRDHVVERQEFEDLACGRNTTERLCNAS